MQTHTTTQRLTLTALACAALLALTACDKAGQDRTAGEKVDAAINTMEKKAETAGEKVDAAVSTMEKKAETAGEKVDAAVNTMEKKADTVGADVQQGVAAVKEGAANAATAVADKARDAAITTQINADLARDPELSALKINVDTDAGKVVLKGNAPNAAARERAAAKALAVVGVTAVDNQLRVGS